MADKDKHKQQVQKCKNTWLAFRLSVRRKHKNRTSSTSKINKEDDRAFIVEEYKRDIDFYQTVLQKQWEDMWETWERQYSEWEAENQL